MEDSYVLQLPERKFHDLYLCLCGYSKCGPMHNFGPAVRPNYILHYILDGKGQYCVGNTQYDLHAGQGFLIEPNVQTFYQADGQEPWTYLWIGFNGNHAREYLQNIGLNSSHLVYHSSHGNELKLTVINMLKHNTSATANQFLLESLLYSFFAILAQDIGIVSTSQENKDNLYISRAIEYIHDNYSNAIRVSDIADYVCVDRSYLYTLFHRNIGVSPQDYLANYRITCATELLALTNLPISGIAYSCGYKDPLVFAKAFKQKKGMAPSIYRKKHRQESIERLQKNENLLETL